MTRSSLSAPLPRCFFISSTTRLVTAALFILSATQLCRAAYYGKFLGKLSELHHGVSGEVYAIDGRTLYLKDFTYDGEGPTAYFYASSSKSPNSEGFRIRDERGTPDVLKKYRKKGVTLTLPEGKTLNNIKWFYVWCEEFAVNFGDVRIPRGFDYPRPQKLAGLNGVHGVSSEPIVVVDAQTLLIPGFSYDGEAPDAKFWVGRGAHPTPQGDRVPDENGRIDPLRSYDRKTIVLTLPGNLTVHELGHFGVWCEAFTVDFGHVQIPPNLNVPPSLKMLGVSPQSKLNCEVLEDNLAFEVRWAVAGDSIVVQLVGKLDDGQYMSFGLSATPERSVMVGGDIVVAWVDKQTLQGYAVDYFLDAKSQCSGGRGSCPDTRIQVNTNSVRLLNAAMVNGYSIVTYQRPLKASDELDRQIRTNGSQAIIWAIGPLNERNEVSFHSHYLKTDKFIEFGRPPSWNCPMPDGEMQHIHAESVNKESKQELVVTTRRPRKIPPTPAPAPKTNAWEIPPIECYEPEDGVLYAQLGPTGGKHGYPAITGHVGWGISWYINGLLIPVINVVRGQKYTFIVEAGNDPDVPARYHPFYITDDPIGGYEHKTPEEKAKVKIFAGVKRQGGNVRPTGVGRLCNWLHDQNEPEADTFTSFGAFQRTLKLKCDHGEPGFVEWTPDANTPDTVYYQCFTHRYLGWKINVVDSCDDAEKGQASENLEVYAEPVNQATKQDHVSDMEGASSFHSTSKVTQAPEFYDHHRNNHHANYHHLHHHQFHHHNHHNPHPNSQLDQTSRYHLHNQHVNYPSYASSSNNNQAMNVHAKLIMSNGNTNNNKAQLTPTSSSTSATSTATTTALLNAPVGLTYETRDQYEHSNIPSHHSYDDRVSPMRSYHYPSIRPMVIHHSNHYQQQQMPNHHNFHHHSHGITRTQLNGDSMNRHGPMSLIRLHRTDSRSPLIQPNNAVPYYREIPSEKSETATFNGWPNEFAHDNIGVNVSSDLTPISVLQNFPDQHRAKLENDQEFRQTSTVPMSILSPSSSNQPSSNLVTDQRPIMNYGQMKYAFSHPGTSQYVYSRPSQNHPTIISSNLHKPSQQLMIIRRPIVQHLSQRRPIIGTMMMPTGMGQEKTLSSSPLQSQSRPMLMERKKAIYQGPSQKIISITKQNLPRDNNDDNNKHNNDINNNINNNDNYKDSINNNHHQHHITKLMKMENEQRAEIQAKMSTDEDTTIVDRNTVQSSVIKPARNTGFDPDSIVIESGFKPMIRNLERDTSAGRSQEFKSFSEQLEDYSMDEADRRNENDNRYEIGEENFEPVFVSSPLDRNNAKKQDIVKKFNRFEEIRRKTKLDDLDDMEMAADRVDSYYLPPTGTRPKIVNEDKIEEGHKSYGTLVTFDGKLIEDGNLARSIPRTEDTFKRSKSRLSSEILRKTPQFGKFKGELPPPIPGEVRIDNSQSLEKQNYANSRDRVVPNGGVTRLKALNRNERSTNNQRAQVNFDSSNSTDFIRLHFQDHSSQNRSSNFQDDHNHSNFPHSREESPMNFDREPSDTENLSHRDTDHDESSTGEMIIANIQYIVLTIILYYAI